MTPKTDPQNERLFQLIGHLGLATTETLAALHFNAPGYRPLRATAEAKPGLRNAQKRLKRLLEGGHLGRTFFRVQNAKQAAFFLRPAAKAVYPALPNTMIQSRTPDGRQCVKAWTRGKIWQAVRATEKLQINTLTAAQSQLGEVFGPETSRCDVDVIWRTNSSKQVRAVLLAIDDACCSPRDFVAGLPDPAPGQTWLCELRPTDDGSVWSESERAWKPGRRFCAILREAERDVRLQIAGTSAVLAGVGALA